MNPIKRQFPSCLSPAPKKLRRHARLEDLANELFCEIFEYLDGCDIYQAFANLNSRFDYLLLDTSLRFKIRLSSDSVTKLEGLCRKVVVPNRHRLRALTLSDDSLVDQLFDYCSFDSSFTCLQSVVLSEISEIAVLTVFPFLHCLPYLFSLTIELQDDYYSNLSSIYRLIFHLPHLKSCRLSISDSMEDDGEYPIIVPKSMNKTPSTIERLVIDHPCTIEQINSLLLHTPFLKSLTCERLIDSDEHSVNTRNNLPTLTQLTHISIGLCDVDFNDLENFLKPICRELRVLRLTVIANLEYLIADLWKNFIRRYTPHLSKLYFHLTFYFDSDDFFSMDHRDFLSSFWREKNWSIKFEIYLGECSFYIRPSRQMWYNCHRNDCINTTTMTHDNHSRPCILPIQLSLDAYMLKDVDAAFIEKMKSFSITTSITHLEIPYEKTLHGLLVEIINLLPNLHSIEILSTSSREEEYLSRKTWQIVSTIPTNNKITNVKLQQMKYAGQISSLMDMFPQMQYFEVGCKAENDMISTAILVTRNCVKHMQNLQCLCISIPNADEKLIDILRIIIDFEKPFYPVDISRDYKIHRSGDKIFVNWKA